MNKKVYIWDCDYLENPNNLYNVMSMKVSSYHKQLGDEVHLIYKDWLPTNNYDIMYVIREFFHSKLPPINILDDSRTIALGGSMDYFPSYIDLPMSIAACRPDYLLFNDKAINRRRIEKVQYIQLMNNKKFIPLSQNYENSFSGKKINIVVDKDIWDLDRISLLEVLDKLKDVKQIAFQWPIKLKPLIENPDIQNKFIELHFDKVFTCSFINNYGNTTEKIKEIIDFLSAFTSYKHFKPIKVQAITKQHKNAKDARNDLFRDLEIINYSKLKEVKINMTTPKYRVTEFLEYFTELKIWTNNYRELSFIEFMTRYSTGKTIKNIEEVLNNRIEWLSYNTRQLIYLIKNYYDIIEPFIYRQWGDKFFEIELNLEYIRKEI